ncbi:MAG TPA: 1,4-dihydroxy-2-naphthoate polyprenyltransferase [Nitriliruptoraceae bacterium]|nr:1,4-dihydroxy-2-naphthoate polyprenyltransferase [Nitriliruptoraceae bacterium]
MDTTTPTTTVRQAWIEAIRPRTLPAAVAPVLVGTAASDTALAWSRGEGPAPSLVRFVLAGLVALLLQVAVNFANDYFDGVGGIDTADRVGPLRGVGSGLIAPSVMKRAMVVTLAAAAVVGLGLAALAGWELLLVGVLALVATLGYSGGPRPYASAGLGEVVVFVFFGLVATAGSAYVQDEALAALPLVLSVAMGLFATAMLVVNNLRDIPTDREVGKVTLAVRLGDAHTRTLWLAMVVGAYLVVVVAVVMTSNAWIGLGFLSVMRLGPAIPIVRHAPPGPRLVTALGLTGQAQLLFAVLVSLGLLLDGWLGGGA